MLIACAAGTFSVYLVNDNPCFRRCFIQGKFVSFAHENVIQMISGILLSAVFFLIAVLMIDILRQRMFKVFRIHRIAELVVEKISFALDRII